MDDAQNHFSFEEFQKFKQTLPNFLETWNNFNLQMKGKKHGFDS
jgi:hypothetical protein